jgi:hypothetical protein
MDEYLKIVSQLPLPTVAQTEAFAKHVTEAHSWYKHLPAFPPGQCFTFFLDPQAGRQIQQRGGPNEFRAMFEGYKGITQFQMVITDITKDTKRVHYSMRLTEDYRREFGYWHFRTASDEHWGKEPLHVFSIESVALEPESQKPVEVPIPVKVPDELVQQCGCRLTAFIRGALKHRTSLLCLYDFFNGLERYLEGQPNSPYLKFCRQLRSDVEQAGVFSLRPDSICDIFLEYGRSQISGWQFTHEELEQGGIGRRIAHHFDAGPFITEQHHQQKEQLLNTLIHSREVFRKLGARTTEG